MRIGHPAARRTTALTVVLALVVGVGVACTADAAPSPTTTVQPTGTPFPTLAPTLAPTATPDPTPHFTNAPDPELAALLPGGAGGVPVVVPAIDEFALTPGDVGLAYGDIGQRFTSLAIGYTEEPRTTLYAMRVEGDPVSTADLEPHLATAGRYVGIAGLHREPWQLGEAGGHAVWVRAEDAATAAGTRIYTWASGEYVFLLIGTNDAVNRSLIAGLPGEPPGPARAGSPSPSASAP